VRLPLVPAIVVRRRSGLRMGSDPDLKVSGLDAPASVTSIKPEDVIGELETHFPAFAGTEPHALKSSQFLLRSGALRTRHIADVDLNNFLAFAYSRICYQRGCDGGFAWADLRRFVCE
jgi:hypothetical protein